MGKNAAAEYGGAPAANRAERERRRKGVQSAVFLTSRRTFTPRRRNCAQSKYVRIVGTKKEQQKRCPTAHIAFRARRTPCRAVFCSPLLRPGGRKKARPPGTLFLKGHHKFALWNDTIALRLKKTGRAAFPTIGAAKTAHARQHPCAAAKAPRRFPHKRRGKNSAPACTLARRQKPHARIVGQRQAPRRRTERSESAAHAKERRKPALLLLTSRLAIVYNYKRAVYNLICLWR